jgi:hypothetical protein
MAKVKQKMPNIFEESYRFGADKLIFFIVVIVTNTQIGEKERWDMVLFRTYIMS